MHSGSSFGPLELNSSVVVSLRVRLPRVRSPQLLTGGQIHDMVAHPHVAARTIVAPSMSPGSTVTWPPSQISPTGSPNASNAIAGNTIRSDAPSGRYVSSSKNRASGNNNFVARATNTSHARLAACGVGAAFIHSASSSSGIAHNSSSTTGVTMLACVTAAAMSWSSSAAA